MLKAIDGIVPHRLFYYKSCFFCALFPIVQYYGKDIYWVMLNDTVNYGMIHTVRGEFPTIRYQSAYSLEKRLSDMGIIQEEKDILSEDDLIAAVTVDIGCGSSVILWVDCYEIKYKKDTYKKEHIPHSILILGVDASNKTCHIIDNDDLNSINYDYKVIDFHELYCAYRSYIDELQMFMNSKTYFGYKYDESLCREDAGAFASDYYKIIVETAKNNGYQSEQVLDLYQQLFEKSLNDTNHLQANLQDYILSMNDIVNARRAEQKKLDYLLDSNLSLLQKEQADLWDSIRVPFVRYSFTHNFREKDFAGVIDNLMKIKQSEKKWNNVVREYGL